jgi:hypothetical protein
MHTIERLNATLAAARAIGYGVRHEWLGGAGGGVCELKGRKWLFVDLAQSAAEQLEAALEALAMDPAWQPASVAPATATRRSVA